jgi:hypothetical protein
MDSMNRPGVPSTGFSLTAALGAVARFAVALFGALLMVGALLMGLLLGLTLMIFALLRGRRPQGVQFMWRKGQWPGRPRNDPAPASRGEVVDIDARVIAPDESKPQQSAPPG